MPRETGPATKESTRQEPAGNTIAPGLGSRHLQSPNFKARPTVSNEPRETIRPSLPSVMPVKEPSISGSRPLRVLFYVIAGLMAVFVFGAFLLPREVSVDRSTVIRATPGEVFARLDALKKWEAWGPWFERDPFLEKVYSGPESGPGAMLAWNSKKEGEGKLKILSSNPPGSLRLAVIFGEGNEAEMAFDVSGTGSGTTEVKWTFHTDFGSNMARRYFGLVMPGLVGRDLEDGLESLKKLLEKPAAAQ